MTRKEAIERIKMILEEATANEDAVCYVTSDDADALCMAVKALEQMVSLDKIRAEIEEYWKYCDDNLQAPTLRGVHQILDKYKAESEDEE